MSNLPPGCRVSDIPGHNVNETCEVCHVDASDCTCPECPICGAGDPKCTHMDHPVKRAVMPLITAAQDRARQQAQGIIDAFREELVKAEGDAHQVAPYPSSVRDKRREYERKKARYDVLRAITRPVSNGHPRFGRELREMDAEACARFIQRAAHDAREQYLAFVEKLLVKVGEGVTSATLVGNHVWQYSELTIVKASGTECWRTSQIVNVSKLGRPFNQWPTRKVK